ncbi:MAG: DMT family transporter [Planctomycetes bacterium]|nr:DMT family transporter [Planctomycetota bacterium]
MPHSGELCALLTALCFTASSTSFALSSRAVGGIATNQFRLWLAVPVLGALAWLASGSAWLDAGAERLLWLCASGLAGLVLGDIGYFHALATIGPRISAVLMATWPALAVAMALPLGERPDLQLFVGVLLMLAGVVLVLLRSREGSAWAPGLTTRAFTLGVLGALLGAFGQALGVVLAKRGMAPAADLPDGVDPLAATFVRMLAGALGVQVVATLQRQPFAGRAVLGNRTALLGASFGMVFGPVLGVWLSMVATKNVASTGVAAALMATMPLFMMPVARLVYGARIGGFGVFGTLLAVGGAVVLLLRP